MPRRANTAHARRHPFHRLAAAWLVVLTIGLVVLSTVFVYQFYLPKPVGFAHGLSAGSLTTDAIVYDVQSIGGVTYLTGAFSNVGLHAGGLAKLDPSTAALSASLPGVPSGSSVFTLVSDGSSGWYAGGNFSTIGGVAVARLAHILSDGTVDANWNPNPSAQVNSLVLDGTTLYVGGQFTTIGGQSRRFLGAVSASTGLATSFNSANSLTGGTQVRVIKSDGTSLYVGGDFTGPAARLVRFSLSGGTYDATWTPTAPNADVYGLDVSSASVVYVVGAFTTPRNFAVAYGKPAGATQAWAPAGIGSARDVILSGSTTYLAWTTGLKGFDATSGATLSWDASPGGLEVSDIELNGTTLYAAGAFTSIGGQTRHYLAALDTTVNSNNATAWNPSAGSVAKFVTRVGSDVIAGGGFTLMNGQARNGVAAVDPATQSLLPFTQNVATPIYSIAGSGNTLYIASPQAITAIDATTGGSVWQVIVDGNATVLRLDGSTLYAGGYFTSQGHIFYDDEACYSGCYVADNTRNHAMAIDATNGNLLPWDPNVTTSSGQPVKDLAVGTDTIYIGGSSVTAVGGTARVGLAAVVKSTGAVTAWDPAIAPAAASINRIILSGTTLYVGGTFTSIGGAARTGLAALDTAVNSNMATAWNPTLSPAGLTTMALTGTTMFIGSGSLSTVNGLSRPRLAVVTTTVDSGASMVGAWNPDISAAGLIDMEVWDSKLYIAGDFTNVGTNGNPRLGAFDLSSVNFSPTSATVSESAGSVSLTGVITPTVSADLTVNLQSGGGSATDGQDLTLPGSLTITANNVSGSASIPITDDHVDEDDETITLGMALQSPDAVVGTNNSYTLTIQDNDTSGFTLTPSGALTANEGTSTSYSIVLTSQPTADVTVTLGTDASQLTLPGGALTFTSANWDTPQLVNVDVNDNAVDDGDRAVHITHTVGSSDPKYSVLTIGDKVVNVTDNDTTGITVDQSSGSTAVTEGGAADSYTVVLTSQPTADVTVDLTNGGQIQVNPSSLTFTAGTWNVPQTVTVTAVDNQIAENPLQEPIHQAVTSADPLYAAVSLPDVDVAVTDDDTADITLTQSNGVTAVVEGSTTDSYTVVLTSQPTADVNVALSHSAQVQTSANTLTFTGVTWNVPQTVTVTAVDDDVAEGAHADTVSHLVTSADPFYDGFGLGDVNVQVGDNDAAGLQVVESNASSDVVEGSTTDSITVALTSQPTQQVDVALGTDAGQLTANPGSLQFNAGNWDQPQQVDLAAVNDDVAEDATVTPLSFTTTSADSFYDGAVTADVNVQVGDNDTAALFTVTNDGETVEEGGSSAQFTLQLTSQPTADVQVDLAFNDQVIDTDTQALQFTAGTWSTPQAVMVFAVDDDIAEGVHDGAVDFTAVSADSKYNGSTTSPIAVSVIDNDSAGVVVTESSGSTLVKEGEGPDSLAVHLTSQPTANVTIAATADTAQLACTTTLTFTTGNWNHDQDVTCTANDDKVAESTTVVPISFAAASADANYQGVHVDTVYATVEDNDIGDKVTVVGGANAIQQAISLSKLNFPTDGTASGVVVARDDLAVDVFTGTSYNVASNSPVLLVKTKALPREVLDEVDRVLGPNKGKPVVLAGGTAAVSSAVEDALKLHGYTNVKRFNGATRRATALLFAQGLDAFNEKPATKLVVADDRSLVDALSMAPVASQFEDHVADPILISTRGADAVDPAIVDYLHAHGTITDVELVGGPQALTTGFESNLKQQFPQLTVTRTAGADRFATNLAVLEAHFTQPRTLAVARGDTAGIPGSTTVSASVTPPTLYTALLASGFVSRLQGPVVLVRKTSIPSGTRQYLAQHHETIDVVYVVAQPGGISATVRSDLTALTH